MPQTTQYPRFPRWEYWKYIPPIVLSPPPPPPIVEEPEAEKPVQKPAPKRPSNPIGGSTPKKPETKAAF